MNVGIGVTDGTVVWVKVAVCVGDGEGVEVNVGTLVGEVVGVGWFKSTKIKLSKICWLTTEGA